MLDDRGGVAHPVPLPKRVLQGVGYAFALTALRWLGAPPQGFSIGQVFIGLLAVSVGGGVGGAVFYATDPWRANDGAARTIANVLSMLVALGIAAVIVIVAFR